MKRNTQLLIIDPQFDFCDPTGALYVKGAEHDIARLATLINRAKDYIDDVRVTLDSHQPVHIAVSLYGQHGVAGANVRL